MFELNQLRSFVAIASEMSFRRAAETLNMKSTASDTTNPASGARSGDTAF